MLISLKLIVLLLVAIHSISCHASLVQPGPPVILIPSLEGSRLEIRTTPDRLDLGFTLRCPNLVTPTLLGSSAWRILWLDPVNILPGAIDCFVKYAMKLHYNTTTRTTQNSPGVEIRAAPGGFFGDTDGVETMNPVFGIVPDILPSPVPELTHMKPLVDYFVSTGRYERGVNLRAAPYDWRRPPTELGKYFASLKNLIEQTFKDNGQTPVILLTHSMGGLEVHYFLTTFLPMVTPQPQQWKEKYIHKFIPISAPFGGSMESLKSYVTGRSAGVILYANEEIKDLETTMPVLPFLQPNRNAFSRDRVLVRIGKDTVTVRNISWLIDQLDIPYGVEMYENVKDILTNLTYPGVDVLCIYSTGLEVTKQLVYPTRMDFQSKRSNPQVVMGVGDGVVNLKSLESCLKWSSNPRFAFSSKVFTGIEHARMIQDRKVIKYVFDYITNGL